MYLGALVLAWIGWAVALLGLMSVNPVLVLAGGFTAYWSYSFLKGGRRG